MEKNELKLYTVLLSLLAVLLLLTHPATAKAQSGPYSTAQFSANFNGPVTVDGPNYNTSKTSSSMVYSSFVDGIGQGVHVRTVYQDIDVNFTTSDFYANEDPDADHELKEFRSNGYYQGHPFTYHLIETDYKGTPIWERERIIVVNSREVIFIVMVSTKDDSNLDVWTTFENSLDIK